MLSRFAWVIAFLSLAIGTPALAQNIDTRAAATTAFTAFGYGGATQTYGQTFTVPGGQTAVSSFSFKLATVPATATFRGVLMQWNSGTNRATGPVLYQSGDVTTTGATVQDVTFTIPGSAPVTAGQTYVIFASTVNSAGSGSGGWSMTNSDVLPGGRLVYQNAGSQSDWTGTGWFGLNGNDFGVTVNFGPAPVPTLSEWAMILFGLILAGGAALYIQRRQLIA
ncbi:IPTL-CTERM sorting domain-containing protein [Brevundimonas sp. TWP2-3-4b1]|uniref:IPTL-CTERM sorting domain-containing protein n=1 Tax=Brevundimonas sp. TWP2-3-4b1 TaxID=2804580 RepID=UPI003CEBC6F2